MDGIVLQNFSSILEILTVYYIGSATSENFKNFFGINETFGIALKKNELFPVLKELRYDDVKIDGESITQAELQRKAKEAKKIGAILSIYVQIDKLVKKKYNYLDSPNLFKCLRPFYIYFGTLAFGFLLLSGLIEKWHRSYSLIFLNSVSIVMVLILIRKMWKIGDHHKHWGTIKSFIFSVAIIILIISIPENLANKYFTWPMPSHFCNNKLFSITYMDFHNVFGIALLFIPIIFHMSCLVIVMARIYLLKTRLIGNGILLNEIETSQKMIEENSKGFFSDIPDLETPQNQ